MKLFFIEVEELLHGEKELNISTSTIKHKLNSLGYRVNGVAGWYNIPSIEYKEIGQMAEKFGKPAVVIAENDSGKRFLVRDDDRAMLVNLRSCSKSDKSAICHAFTYNNGTGALTLYKKDFWVKPCPGNICIPYR